MKASYLEKENPASANPDALRSRTVDIAKTHKASWIELGQCLFAVQKDKLFKQWGYLTFEAYCIKELGIKQTTAAKLLKSYYFLEKEEPAVISQESLEDSKPPVIPHYESVNLLRLAKENPKIQAEEFGDLRKAVLSSAKEPKEVRGMVKQILLNHDEAKNPNEVRQARRNAAIKRVIMVLGGAKRELESEGLIPEFLIKQMNDLIAKMQDQIEK